MTTTCGNTGMEDTGKYDDNYITDMGRLYPGYEDMDYDTLTSELNLLNDELVDDDLEEGDAEDIEREIAYVNKLRRRRGPNTQAPETLSYDKNGDMVSTTPEKERETSEHTEDVDTPERVEETPGHSENGDTKNLSRKDLEEMFPEFKNLTYDELGDRGDALLIRMVEGGEDFSENAAELRYVRMLRGDHQRESKLNELFNLRDRSMRRNLTDREDIGRLRRFRRWATKNLGVLSALAITVASILTGTIIASRKMLRSLGDASREINKKLKRIETKQRLDFPPIFDKLASGLEWISENILTVLISVVVGVYTIYKLLNIH